MKIPMRQIFFSCIAMLLSVPAHGDNYATCALGLLSGVENDSAAVAAAQICREKFPGGIESVEQGAGRGFFSFKSAAECAYDKAKNTPSRAAAYQIRAACNRLYDAPPIPWEEYAIENPPPPKPQISPDVAAHYKEILQAHPDAIQLSESADFELWKSQVPERARRYDAGTTKEVIELFNEYKAQRKVDEARMAAERAH